jgi:vesicle coat complex subunit
VPAWCLPPNWSACLALGRCRAVALCLPPWLPQVFILDSIAEYTPTDEKDAEGIVERVAPRLQHVNAAVVLSAVKVILGCMQVKRKFG